MNLLWLLRMKRWAQRPPSWRRVLFGLAIIGGCVGLYLIEQTWGWPDWLTPERVRGRGLPNLNGS